MRPKIVLRRRAVPLNVTVSIGTSFAARYERISRKNLPGNIKVIRTQTIDPRKRRTKKKKVTWQVRNMGEYILCEKHSMLITCETLFIEQPFQFTFACDNCRSNHQLIMTESIITLAKKLPASVMYGIQVNVINFISLYLHEEINLYVVF